MKHLSTSRILYAIFSAVCLYTPQIHADVTYRLVTSNDMLIDRCVYLMVAEDLDIAAANEWSSPTGIKTTAITRDGNTIKLPAENKAGEFILRRLEEKDFKYCTYHLSYHTDFIWGFKFNDRYITYDFNNRGLVSDKYAIITNVTNPYIQYHYHIKLSLSDDNTLSSALYANAYPAGSLAIAETQDGYTMNAFPNNDTSANLHKLQLYQKSIYDLKVLSIKKVDDNYEIKIHINTFADTDPYSKGDLMYLFCDDDIISNDDIYHHENMVKKTNYNSGDLTITHSGTEKYLWLIRDHGSDYYQTDAIRVELKETPLPVTSAEAGHFTYPAADGYAIGTAIDFEPKDSDVKIYYTLDGNDPVIPANTPAPLSESNDDTDDHAGKTYDLDERPLIYEGSPLSVRYVAVKAGHRPSAVGAVSIPGIPTAIEIIGNDASQEETIYYNMQGLRVCQPLSPGLYIRRQGCKTEKIIVR